MSKVVVGLCCAAILSGCASTSANVAAQYVSPMQYQSYDCGQVEAEMLRVSSKVREVAGAQDKKAKSDQVAMGVGLVLFWPALFFLAGSDRKEELGRLKGEYDALDAAAIQKKCAFTQAKP